MLTKPQVRAILDKTEVFQEGHFVLPSGWHAALAAYPARVLQQPEYATSLAGTLGTSFRSLKPQVILAEAGIDALLGLELARALHARLVLAERSSGILQLAEGQAIAPDERIVLASALLTDQTGTPALAALAEAAGAKVVGLAVLLDRTSEWESPWQCESLQRPDSPLYTASACPLCKAGVPFAPGGAIAI